MDDDHPADISAPYVRARMAISHLSVNAWL